LTNKCGNCAHNAARSRGNNACRKDCGEYKCGANGDWCVNYEKRNQNHGNNAHRRRWGAPTSDDAACGRL